MQISRSGGAPATTMGKSATTTASSKPPKAQMNTTSG